MTYQERVAQLTISAGDALFQSAKAIPADKLDWKTADGTRSALEILRECAYMPLAIPELFQGEGSNPALMEKFGTLVADAETWTTLDAVEAAYRKNVESALSAIRGADDKAMDAELPFPWGGTGKITGANLAMMLYWQLVYHLGQINYIQTMYGDKEMHSGM